jgi:hypothetical protein
VYKNPHNIAYKISHKICVFSPCPILVLKLQILHQMIIASDLIRRYFDDVVENFKIFPLMDLYSKISHSLQNPKTEFGLQNHYGREIYPSNGNFIRSKKNMHLGVKKLKLSLQSPKNGIRAPKSLCSCDISIERKFY